MTRDPARSTKKNVKGKRPVKNTVKKNSPKKKVTKKSSTKTPEPKIEAQNIPVETVFNTVTLLDTVWGQVKDVFKWGKKK